MLLLPLLILQLYYRKSTRLAFPDLQVWYTCLHCRQLCAYTHVSRTGVAAVRLSPLQSENPACFSSKGRQWAWATGELNMGSSLKLLKQLYAPQSAPQKLWDTPNDFCDRGGRKQHCKMLSYGRLYTAQLAHCRTPCCGAANRCREHVLRGVPA